MRTLPILWPLCLLCPSPLGSSAVQTKQAGLWDTCPNSLSISYMSGIANYEVIKGKNRMTQSCTSDKLHTAWGHPAKKMGGDWNTVHASSYSTGTIYRAVSSQKGQLFLLWWVGETLSNPIVALCKRYGMWSDTSGLQFPIIRSIPNRWHERGWLS